MLAADPRPQSSSIMPAPRQPKIPKTNVRIDCGRYLIRTIKPDDASDAWAGGMSDPEVIQMLNSGGQALKKSDIVAYIKQFDQRSHLLLGIFEKASGVHLGIFRIDIDPKLGRFLVFLLIGEAQHRNKGITNEITVPFRDYFFETLGLSTMMATALAHNQAIIHYLLKSGWSLDQKLPRSVKSQTGGDMLDLCCFSMTREAWRAWKQANPPAAGS
jgi:RimJ/RimL family protein N-acetyltransferase